MSKSKPKFIDKLYFAFGSNLHLPQMFRRCADCSPVEKAVLHDYRLTFRGNWRGAGVADVIPSPGDQVEGGLFRVSQEDLEALDRYEGYPTLYDRFDIEVELADGQLVPAFVYRMLDQYEPAAPSDYYFQVIRTGYVLWDLDVEPLFQAREDVVRQTRLQRGRWRMRKAEGLA